MSHAKRYVYVLESQRDPKRHYVGITSDLDRRLMRHNAGETSSTSADRPWSRLVAVEFRTEAVALEFERYLKSASGRAFAKRHFR